MRSVARAALLGARGNSGVILSQLIRGAAEELISRPGELIDPILIGAALASAADQAYGSVQQPAEGTILTVVREMATRVSPSWPTWPSPAWGPTHDGHQDAARRRGHGAGPGSRPGVGHRRARTCCRHCVTPGLLMPAVMDLRSCWPAWSGSCAVTETVQIEHHAAARDHAS